MSHINLLAWRKNKGQLKKQQWLLMCILLTAFSLIMALHIKSILIERLQQQQQRNALLQEKLTIVKNRARSITKIKQDIVAIEKKIIQIEKSINTGQKSADVLIEIAKIINEHGYLSKISQQDDQLLLLGKGYSNQDISALIKKTETSLWFKKVDVTFIKSQRSGDQTLGKNTINEFKIFIQLI